MKIMKNAELELDHGVLILVDCDVVDHPLGSREVVRILDSLLTRSWASGTSVRGTSEIAAKGGINGQDVIKEVTLHIASVRAPKSCRGTPSARVGLLILDILRDVGAGEVPDFDSLVVPEVSKDTASDDVEPVSEGLSIGIEECTTGVIGT